MNLCHLACVVFIGSLAASFGGDSALNTPAKHDDITPESLIRSVANFEFELNSQRQEPESFLRRRRGDCDDFASLANQLLTERGYKTKLVVVMMDQQSHVVCYVPEAHGFLDFNHRADVRPVVACEGTLKDIANRVAKDFRSRWQLASEFRYEKGSPIYIQNVFPLSTEPEKVVAASAIKYSAP